MDESYASPGLTRGREYLVISMMMDRDLRSRHQAGVWLQIIDDTDEASWIEGSSVTTVDSAMPSNWVVVIPEDGPMLIGPASWLERGFWDAIFNGWPTQEAAFAAHEKFRRELAIIRAEDGPQTTA